MIKISTKGKKGIIRHFYVKRSWLLISVILASLVFVADVIFSLGALSLFYIIMLFVTFWFSNEKENIIGSVISSIILVLIGWYLQYRTSIIVLDLSFFYAEIDYEILFRAISIIVLGFVGIILFKEKIRDEELQKLNETLELRIFARTAIAEKRAENLEKQIAALQSLKKDNTNNSINKLDSVISELKKLAEEDKNVE